MIQYDRFVLENGLRVLFHPDFTTPMAVVNVMYDVGARDEDPGHTGFAHLFEHLMFGGSLNIADYDMPLQLAGGENNAYTTNDLTNYYIQLPAENIETALWLESDRMLSLAFDPESLEVQRKVVCEEFKEHYINRPYGNVWHLLRELTYTTHPYRWMTIGKNLEHIENASLGQVKDFFFDHYNPANAILAIAGPLQLEEVKTLVEKWFSDIPSGRKYNRALPAEPPQTAPRRLEVEAKVPLDAFYKTWHMGSRLSNSYYEADLMTEILGGSASSRLYQALVKEQRLFSNIGCYHMGTVDPGVVVVEGKLVKGVSFEKAEAAIGEQIRLFIENVSEQELQKAKNKTESTLAFEDMSLLNRANNLAFYELLGDAGLMNTEAAKYDSVSLSDLRESASRLFREENSNTLLYRATA